MSPYCSDLEKYETIKKIIAAFEDMAAKGGSIAGSKIEKVITISGARVQLANGAWTLVRASSNTPNLVVVCESPNSEAEMRTIFEETRAFLDGYPEIGEYDQTL
jgi:phosphomannomutase/phosphoglucomutase